MYSRKFTETFLVLSMTLMTKVTNIMMSPVNKDMMNVKI